MNDKLDLVNQIGELINSYVSDASNIVDGINKCHNNSSLYYILEEDLKTCKDKILKLINGCNVYDKPDTKKKDSEPGIINDNPDTKTKDTKKKDTKVKEKPDTKKKDAKEKDGKPNTKVKDKPGIKVKDKSDTKVKDKPD